MVDSNIRAASVSKAVNRERWKLWGMRFAKGLFSIALTLLGLLLITFVIGRVMPIDPVLAVLGDSASEASYQKAYLELGLDQPLWKQFILFLRDVLSGDLGVSLLTSRPVTEDLIRVFPATVELATLATILGVLFGIPLGILAAVYQGRWIDQAVRLLGLFGYSMPIFWLGLIGLLVFYGMLGWVGGPGRLDIYYLDLVPTVTGMFLIDSLLAGETDVFWNAVSHIILPASLLGYYSLAYLSRMTRSFMLEQLSQEYIVTARVKGLSEWGIVWRHALANIRVPLITVIALSYASLLEGSVLTEVIFAWPGLGSYMTNALLSADMNAVLGGTLLIGVIFIGLNLLSDWLYRWFDPRV